MKDLTPTQRVLRSRMGGYMLHATHDSAEVTKPARAAFLARFETQVDPDGLLSEEERTKRATAARKAYFTKLALKSAETRRRTSA